MFRIYSEIKMLLIRNTFFITVLFSEISYMKTKAAFNNITEGMHMKLEHSCS